MLTSSESKMASNEPMRNSGLSNKQNQLMRGVSGLDLDILDRAQRMQSTITDFESPSPSPYAKQLERRVAELEQKNQWLIQTMLFM
jgi:hypothetical protein